MTALKPCLGPGERLPEPERAEQAIAEWRALPRWRRWWEWVKG